MIIYGKDYHFALTVGAAKEISDLCPGGDLDRVGELLTGSYGNAIQATAEIICALSRGYERKMCFETPGHDYAPLTEEMLLSLDTGTFTALESEALAAFSRDSATTVAVEPEKKRAEPETRLS